MQIVLKKLEVRNFRNIKSATYNFGLKSAISGQNRIGKSNTLEAINYLLTGTLLTDTNNLATIKPLEDPKSEVFVEGTFERSDGVEFRLAKKYGEDWVKPRGGDVLEMKGHYTKLFINGTEYKTEKSYLAMVMELFNLNELQLKTSVDSMRMLTNPYYLAQDIDWKLLRQLIIELVGDVTNENVIQSDSKFERIRPTLARANNKIDLAIKTANQKVSSIQEQISALNAVIDNLKSKNDVDPIALSEARLKVEMLNKQIEVLKAGRKEDIVSKNLKDKLIILQNKYNDSKLADREKFDEQNRTINEELQKLYKEKEEKTNEFHNLQNKALEVNSKLAKINYDEELLRSELQRLSERREALLKEFDKVANQSYIAQKNECPNCHYILNAEEIEEKSAEFEKLKNARLDAIEIEGKSINTRLQQIDFELEELAKTKNDLETEIQSISSEISTATDLGKSLGLLISEKLNSQEVFKLSEATELIESDIEKTKNEIRIAEENYKNQYLDIETNIKELKIQRDEINTIENEHNYYLASLKELKQKESELQRLNDELTDAEMEQILLKTFMKTKLSMLDENVSKVFGNVKFQLIKENIKAGSWDEVCNPYIINKSTLFANGSTSEKILTGIAIIESIKKAKGLTDLPILFDEGEALDSATISNLIVTNSQIICAKVDDNYSHVMVKEMC